ncbi:DnaJ domain-containing protein [Parasphingopyxis sp. GrpM-11]|uniref:DnaJ domain-containing protein n=2 Tax=Parasphingopyxis marina TaxID=2761622 RepID=A0A842I2T2_9SPHN|nr:DnaJ domain-containing protein [Parasphingopyxis marina]
MPVAEARELLGVPDDADQETIRAAHRRLIAKVHPDAGGSVELARRVNAAREILLSEARNHVPERHD